MTDRIIRIKVDPSGANKGIREIDGNMQQLGGTTDRLQTQLTRVAQAVAAAFSVRQIVAYADAYTNIQNRLRVVTDGTEQLTRVTGELLEVANATRANYETTATLFSTLARSTEELAISEERLIGITRTINQTFAVSGASAQEASNAIRQLSQGLASGALRGDEFNSVAEQAPGILRAVAAETGKTIGELREFAATGGITAELLISAIENYSDTVEREYAKTNRTFEQSATVARNNAIAFVGSSELIQEATAAAGNTLVTLSNNLETVGEVLTFVALVIAGRWVGSLSVSAVALINNTRVALSAKVATDSLGVAISRTSVAANAGAIAMRGLSASMAFLGGPVGVVLLAASALLIFADNASEAEDAASKARLGGEIDELVKRFKTLNEQGQAITFQKLTDEQIALSSSLREVNDRIIELEDAQRRAAAAGESRTAGALAVGLSSARDRAAELSGALDDLTAKQQALFDLGAPPEDSFINPDNLDKSTEAVGRLGDSLEALRSVSSGIDKLFSGEFNLFGDEDTSIQDEQTAARINSRIEGLRLETQTISSEYALQAAIRQQVFTQEEADLANQTANRILSAVAEREILLAEDAITKEQQLEVETAFQEQLSAINQLYSEQRLELQRQVNLEKQAIEQQTQQTYLDTASTALGALAGLVGGSTKAAKALKLVQAGVNAFQVFAASQAAAALVLATPPGPVLNPALGPLAASIIAKGKVSAAAILAGGAASAFSGGGGGSGLGSLSTGGSNSSSQALPTTPQGAQQVQSVEFVGFNEVIDELRNQDGMVSTRFVASILDKVQDANRLRGEG